MKIVSQKLEIPIEDLEVMEICEPIYYLPQLDPNTTKDFWFNNEPRIAL